MLIKALRTGLGQLIVFGDALTRPRPQRRSAQGQAAVVKEASNLSLYQFHACPFCVKTRRALHRLNVPVTLHDAKNDAVQRERLRTEGGKIKVPCLHIQEHGQSRWLYESNEIIAYLEQRFGGIA
ncbi:glutaredoxin family protein [Eoetvoesiella caeni]|uniref:Glutaredoxin n=1 Tax=Eoetvoesiella caeni TaxID=645616 RepID=A0A366HKA4_9BURK|nr:glutathione S-transferase N-terminal domain-containing protein [Eoetvoesiella caeni]MCI2807210.1 glutathione S-transferase N-terminal domain-containing protein [Eoetvoesiella caeni]NYT53393.1 glutathione S-transferase N-terminal domain-containing protein [Eoetvoesiella caeni]RBP43378.1 glutaredoxin [Eoetvoesiella caeni]